MSKYALCLGAAVCLVVLFVSGCTTPSSNLIVPESSVVKGIRIEIDGKYRTSGIGYPAVGVSGIATNETGRTVHTLMLSFGFYDAKGVKLADAIAVTQSLSPGAKWRFDAFPISPVDRKYEYHEVKLQDVRGTFAE